MIQPPWRPCRMAALSDRCEGRAILSAVGQPACRLNRRRPRTAPVPPIALSEFLETSFTCWQSTAMAGPASDWRWRSPVQRRRTNVGLAGYYPVSESPYWPAPGRPSNVGERRRRRAAARSLSLCRPSVIMLWRSRWRLLLPDNADRGPTLVSGGTGDPRCRCASRQRHTVILYGRDVSSVPCTAIRASFIPGTRVH